MSPHNVTNEQLVQFVLGELPAEKAAETEAHLRRCESCRQAVERLESLLDCAGRMAALPAEKEGADAANRAVLRAARTQPIGQPRRGSAFPAALYGRIIMKSRIGKFTLAAGVILAVVLGLSLFAGNGAAKAYAKMVDQLQRAHTLTFSMVTRTGVESMPTVRLDVAFSDTGHFRSSTADGYVTVLEVVGSGAKGISLVPPTKSYVLFEMANISADPAKDPWVTVERLRALPARADAALGRREIDGRLLEGFQVREDDATTTVWLDPKTGELARAEVDFAATPGMNTILSDFQLDVPLPDSFFSLEPPEGYTPVQVAADAAGVTERDFIEFLRLWSSWTVDATFPPVVSGVEIARVAMQMAQEGKFVGPYAPGYGAERQAPVMYRGLVFSSQLPAGTWRYAGQNVRFGDPAVPIFWYQPQGAPMWRVIYADLHVADVAPENLPK
jgi:outer membrane lipoprotein-sorting protein